MVVTFLPAAADTGVEQERTATPSRCTVQAPHCAMPQPNLVPVIPSRSRSAHSNGTSAGASTVFDSPFIFRVIISSPQRPRADCSPGRDEAAIFRSFYTRSREINGFFTALPAIVVIMSKLSCRVRQITLGLVVLAAVGHANLATDLTGRAPNTSGMRRLRGDVFGAVATLP